MNGKCPYCGSEKVVKRGMNKNEGRGKQQRMKCNGCSRAFTAETGLSNCVLNGRLQSSLVGSMLYVL